MSFFRTVLVPTIIFSYLIRVIYSLVKAFKMLSFPLSMLSENFSINFRSQTSKDLQMISFGIICILLIIYFFSSKRKKALNEQDRSLWKFINEEKSKFN
jgi:dolichol kinase